MPAIETFTLGQFKAAAKKAGVRAPMIDNPALRVLQAVWASKHCTAQREAWDLEDFARWIVSVRKPVRLAKACQRLRRIYERGLFKSTEMLRRDALDSRKDVAWKRLAELAVNEPSSVEFPGATMTKLDLDSLRELSRDTRYRQIGFQTFLRQSADLEADTHWIDRAKLATVFSAVSKLHNLRAALAVETKGETRVLLLSFRWGRSGGLNLRSATLDKGQTSRAIQLGGRELPVAVIATQSPPKALARPRTTKTTAAQADRSQAALKAWATRRAKRAA